MLLGCLFGLGFQFYDTLQATADQAGFYDLETPVTREQLEDFWEQNPLKQNPSYAPIFQQIGLQDMVLFQITEKAMLENASLERSSFAELIQAAGNASLLFPNALLAGNFPASGDETGCIISKKTAETLFSSREALGQPLCWNETTYIVRGILNVDQELCLIQGPRGISYSQLRVQAPGLPLSVIRQQLTGLLSSHMGATAECGLYLSIGRIFFWLPAWGLFCFLQKSAALASRRILSRILARFSGGAAASGLQNKSWLRYLPVLLPALFGYLRFFLSFAGVCALLLGCLHFSDDYVPAAWSDFDFFTELFSQKSAEILTLLKSRLFYPDLWMLESLAGLITVELLASFLLIYWLYSLLQDTMLPLPFRLFNKAPSIPPPQREGAPECPSAHPHQDKPQSA